MDDSCAVRDAISGMAPYWMADQFSDSQSDTTASTLSQKRSLDMANSSTDRDQRQRFIDAARELECDETGEAFDRALGHILPPRMPGEPAPHVADDVKPKGSRRKATKEAPE